MRQKKEEPRGGFTFEVWANRPVASNRTKAAADWLVGYESVWIRILCLLQRKIWGLAKIKERNTRQSLTWSQLGWATFCLRRTKWKAGRDTNQHLLLSLGKRGNQFVVPVSLWVHIYSNLNATESLKLAPNYIWRPVDLIWTISNSANSTGHLWSFIEEKAKQIKGNSSK